MEYCHALWIIASAVVLVVVLGIGGAIALVTMAVKGRDRMYQEFRERHRRG